MGKIEAKTNTIRSLVLLFMLLQISCQQEKHDQNKLRFYSQSNDDPGFVALFMQFGRYLLISSSRKGTQPANLQGIWNKELNPPWESKYTTNVNAQMNYWPAELLNLSECHDPFFRLIEECAMTGKSVAREHYDCDGWVLHHNTDIWRGTAPINSAPYGVWPTGAAWVCYHLWEHYQFSKDINFLRERAYPVLTNQWLKEYIIEDTDPDAPGQLYNLKADPGETINLYSIHPKNVRKLKNHLDTYVESGRSAPAGERCLEVN